MQEAAKNDPPSYSVVVQRDAFWPRSSTSATRCLKHYLAMLPSYLLIPFLDQRMRTYVFHLECPLPRHVANPPVHTWQVSTRYWQADHLPGDICLRRCHIKKVDIDWNDFMSVFPSRTCNQGSCLVSGAMFPRNPTSPAFLLKYKVPWVLPQTCLVHLLLPLPFSKQTPYLSIYSCW
jgi:hypothetical protein